MQDFELLLHELNQLPELVHRARVLDVLRMFAGCRVSIDARALRRQARGHLAASLLKSGMPRLEARRALEERLGVSAHVARGLLRKALRELRH